MNIIVNICQNKQKGKKIVPLRKSLHKFSVVNLTFDERKNQYEPSYLIQTLSAAIAYSTAGLLFWNPY